MRIFEGLKPRLAMELTGFTGVPKTFRTRYRDAAGNAHKQYTPAEIRRIRLDMMGLPTDAARPRTLPPILNFRMAKGGVGKTTLAGNVACTLSMMGYKVLLIDADSQGSQSVQFGLKWPNARLRDISLLMDLFYRNEPAFPEQAIHRIFPDGMLDFIPSNGHMDDLWLLSAMNRDFLFPRLLEREIDFFSKYDAIVIDSAPGKDLLSNALMLASKCIIAPVEPAPLSIEALDVLAGNVQRINQSFAPQGISLDVLVVVNRFSQGNKSHAEALSTLHAQYPDRLSNHIVRDFIGFARATEDKMHENAPILLKEPNSAGARDVIDLTKSLISKFGVCLAGHGLPAQAPSTVPAEEVAA